jgi:serine/threonine protein kinase
LIDEAFQPGQAGVRQKDDDPDRTPVAGARDEGAGPAGDEIAGLGPAPQAVGKYLLLEELDKGGQGLVFRALHRDLRGEFALKLARRPIDLDPAGRDQLREEGRLLARLSHPNLVRVIDLDLHGDRPYLVLEYVAGRTLQQSIQERRPSPREAARLVAALAGAVAYLHAQGVVHQDIKPKNILIDPQGQPRLIDLGLARLRHAWSGEPEASSGGTPAYMAPEQATGDPERIGPWTDVFGLGGVLYYLLTGRAPYEGDSFRSLLEQARTGQIIPPRRINPKVPRSLSRLCLRALARDPQRRPSSAAELEQALRG